MPPTLQELKIPKPQDLGQHSPSCLIGRIRKGPESGGLRLNRVRLSDTFFCGIFTTVSRREAGPPPPSRPWQSRRVAIAAQTCPRVHYSLITIA